MSTGKVVLGALAGLAIGAIAGILFAPEKGSTTRQQIMDKSDDLADDLKAKFDQLCKSVMDKFEIAKTDVKELGEKVQKGVDEVSKTV